MSEKNELSEMFINLLTKASSKQTQELAHPKFYNILDNLSQDEAIILSYLKDKQDFPFIDIKIRETRYPNELPSHMSEERTKTREELKEAIEFQSNIETIEYNIAWNLTGLEDDIQLYFPKNIDVYIDNLVSFGIIEFKRDVFPSHFKSKCDELVSFYDEYVQRAYDTCKFKETSTNKCEVRYRYGYVHFTDIGRRFIDAVSMSIENLKRGLATIEAKSAT